MKRFRIIKIKRENIEEGDLILLENKRKPRFVIRLGETLLHSHPYIEVIVNDSGDEKLMLCDLKSKVMVCRVEDK